MPCHPRVPAALWLAAFVLLALPARTAPAEPEEEAAGEEPAPRATIADLAWLAGAWRMEHDGQRFDEHWLPPAGGTMAAVSRASSAAGTSLYELSAIEPGEGGALVLRIRHFSPGLVPWNSEAKGPGEWTLVRCQSQEAVFENPALPFPRSISYRIDADGVLVARLAPAEGSPRKPMEFHLRAVR